FARTIGCGGVHRGEWRALVGVVRRKGEDEAARRATTRPASTGRWAGLARSLLGQCDGCTAQQHDRCDDAVALFHGSDNTHPRGFKATACAWVGEIRTIRLASDIDVVIPGEDKCVI